MIITDNECKCLFITISITSKVDLGFAANLNLIMSNCVHSSSWMNYIFVDILTKKNTLECDVTQSAVTIIVI